MKIHCGAKDWCKEVFEAEEKDLIVDEVEKIDDSKTLSRGYLNSWYEYEKKKHKTFYAVCPNCKGKTEVKREWGAVVGKEKVSYGW